MDSFNFFSFCLVRAIYVDEEPDCHDYRDWNIKTKGKSIPIGLICLTWQCQIAYGTNESLAALDES